MAAPHCKAVLGQKKNSRQKRAQNGGFPVLHGLNVIFCFLTPKRHILARSRVVWRIMRENRFGAYDVDRWKDAKKKPSKHLWRPISRIRGKETP